MMNRKAMLASAAAIVAFALTPATASPAGVKVGVLTCHVDGGWGFVVGSSKDVLCSYHPDHGVDDFYKGSITKIGVDIGYTRSATIIWDVIAPTSDTRPGALEGFYGGATASATVAVGAGANVLLGGFDKSIALQPVSIEGSSGLDVAAGIGALKLRIDTERDRAPRVAWNPHRNFVAYFDFNSSRLTRGGRMIVTDAAHRAQVIGARAIYVDGHTDTVGSEDYNDQLSVDRARSVKAELVRDGVPEDAIHVAGSGFDDPLVPTPPGVREGKNRRAVIDLRDSERQAER
jgi:outer membrane protein OmpA-like peptidoglycan-associated protein